MRYWSENNPCEYCGAISNISHIPGCRNYGLYNTEGKAISEIPCAEEGRCNHT